MSNIYHLPHDPEAAALQLLASELGATIIEEPTAEGDTPGVPEREVDPIDEAMAEADAARMAANGVQRHLTLLRHAPGHKPEEPPMEIDL